MPADHPSLIVHTTSHAPPLVDDLPTLLQAHPQRRRLLGWLAATAVPAGLLASQVPAWAAPGRTRPTPTPGGSSGGIGNAACPTIPDETAGPYPGDGSNGVNALTMSGIVRSDIRPCFAGRSGTATGMLLVVRIKLVNSSLSCGGLAGRAIYLWHADRSGQYSLYSSAVAQQNYLRGVQVTDANGEATFVTVFPGCYSGRWPHMHFEVYNSLATAISGSYSVKTSQLAMPPAACAQVYGTVAGYEASVANYARISLASDNVFGDDSAARQLATVTGDVSNGFLATLAVGITSS